MKKATLKDIARLAGVSVSTVSRVVNGSFSKAAKPETQDRIWDAVKELNYVPNTAAQILKSAESKTELKTVACFFSRASDFKSDPFFSEISRAIETELLQQGYLMKYSVSIFENPSKSIELLLSTESVDGVIIVGRTREKHVELIRKYTKNIVYVGLNRLSFNIDQVICDGYEAAVSALNYLEQIGIEDGIYYLGESNLETRYEAFRDYLNDKGVVDNVRDFVIETPFSSQKGYENLLARLNDGLRPKGIFCGNDITALGAIKALKETGISVPEDVSLISIDNIEMAQFSNPMLTTIDVPREQLGRMAARHMIDKINYGELPVIISLPSSLVVRESTRIKKDC